MVGNHKVEARLLNYITATKKEKLGELLKDDKDEDKAEINKLTKYAKD
jgi:hypothetical protein